MLSNPTAYWATILSVPFPASKISASIGSGKGNNPQRALPRFENLGINRIAKRGDESVDAAADSFDNQVLRRRRGMRVDIHFVAALAQAMEGGVADVGGGKYTELLVWHYVPNGIKQPCPYAPHTHNGEMT